MPSPFSLFSFAISINMLTNFKLFRNHAWQCVKITLLFFQSFVKMYSSLILPEHLHEYFRVPSFHA